jgi:hypothetical protein
MSGPIRGLHDVEGQLYAVSGSTLYRITNQGVAIPLGQIPGVGRVSMAHNQVAGGHQLTVVNGVGGYVWNTADQTFTIITDEGFPGSSRGDFIDGYMMHVEPFGRFLLHSDLADALDFNTLDRFEAETQPDKTVSLIVNGSEVWAFGERTIDVFANVGTAQGTFQNKKVGITTGCIAGASPAVVDSGAAWLGDDRVVYHARGYSPTRISTRALEVELSRYSLADIRNAFSFVYADRGHTIYYLTVPNGMTFGYDFSTGLWHRRSSWHPEKDVYGRWCLSDLVRSNGRWIGGDYRTGKLYVLDWDYPLEGCEPLIRERTTPVAHNNGARFDLNEVELLFDTGGPEVECVPFPYQPVGPQISGEAPDGLTGDPYTFTYTVTPGSSPIARIELRDTELPAGWEWDDQTATISHDDTPVPVGVIRLQMRVIDQNGLYADHEDEFLIAQEHFLLITGSAASAGQPMFATARALSPVEISGIPQDTGADLAGGSPGYWNGLWVVVGDEECRYSTDLASWGTAESAIDNPVPHVTAGPSGWLAGRYATAGSTNISKLTNPPGDFASTSWDVAISDIETDHVGAINLARYVDGKYYADLSGRFMSTDDLDGTWTLVDGYRPDGVAWFYDIVKFKGDLYIACEQETGVVVGPPRRFQVRRWVAETGSFSDIVVDSETGGVSAPFQLAANDDYLIVYCWGGQYVYTSADNFASLHETGIGSTRATQPYTEVKGRQIVATAGQFFMISGSSGDASKANKIVSTIDGLEFTEPVSLGIASAIGIAASGEGDE